jgi:hypothetical protein
MPLLTQLATVKSRLGISDTTDDTLLTNLIKFASARFERETNRFLDRQASTTDEFSAGTCELRVSRYLGARRARWRHLVAAQVAYGAHPTRCKHRGRQDDAAVLATITVGAAASRRLDGRVL